MTPVAIWFTAYILPALVAGTLVKLLPPRNGTATRNGIIIHGALIFSIVVTEHAIHVAGLIFPWHISLVSLFLYLTSFLVAVSLIGLAGISYAVSALIQQLTLLSIAFLLLSAYPVYSVILLVVPAYVLCHKLKTRKWSTRLPIIATWGVTSILLFTIVPSVLFIAALHAIFGSVLISRSIL